MKRRANVVYSVDVPHSGDGGDNTHRGFFPGKHHPLVRLTFSGDVTAKIDSPDISGVPGSEADRAEGDSKFGRPALPGYFRVEFPHGIPFRIIDASVLRENAVGLDAGDRSAEEERGRVVVVGIDEDGKPVGLAGPVPPRQLLDNAVRR